MSRIVAAEMQRPHAPGKDGVRYVEFGSVEGICDYWEVDKSLFSLEAKSSAEILAAGEQLLQTLIPRILARSPTPEAAQLLNRAYSYLCEEDVPKTSDVIFVFGA